MTKEEIVDLTGGLINKHLDTIKRLEAENKELKKSVERITKLYEQERDNNQAFK